MRKLFKTTLGLLASLLILTIGSVCAQAAWDGTAASGFYSGTGTEAAPYVIKTERHLAYFANQLNAGNTFAGKYLSLTADLDMTGGDWSIAPATQFSGAFLGNNHTIKMNSRFLGTISEDGMVDWLNLVADETLDSALLCQSNYGTIQNCRVRGDVSINPGNAALLCDTNYASGTVANSCGFGSVYGRGDDSDCYVGWIAKNSGVIQNCYTVLSLSGSAPGKYNELYTGSITASGTFENCYTGSEVLANDAGFLKQLNQTTAVPGYIWTAGGSKNDGYPVISACLNASTHLGTSSDRMFAFHSNTLTTSIAVESKDNGFTIYYTLDGSDPTTSGTRKLYTGSVTLSGDTVITTVAYKNGKYSAPATQYAICLPGVGSPTNPYLISSNLGLYGIRFEPEKCYRLTKDLDFTDGAYIHNGVLVENWESIPEFSGMLFGDRHSITGLSSLTGGLINSNTGTIQELRLLKHHLSRTGLDYNDYYRHFGAIANTNSGTITRCYAASDSTPRYTKVMYNDVGGIVGQNSGTISYCNSSGPIRVSAYESYSRPNLAGIAGTNSGTIQSCYSDASVYMCYTSHDLGATVGGITNGIYVNSHVYDCRFDGICSIDSYTASFGVGAAENFGERSFSSYRIYDGGAIFDHKSTSGRTYYTQENDLYKTTNSGLDFVEARFLEFDFDSVWMITDEGPMPQGVMQADGNYYTKKSYTAPGLSTGETVCYVNGTSETITYKLPASGLIASGSHGDNLVWILDSDGTLSIRGTGEMADGNYGWRDARIRSYINRISVGSGVTSIGAEAFFGCSTATEIALPNSVTSIGAGAFTYCSGISSITIPASVTSIGAGAFFYCSALTDITIPPAVTSIGLEAFNGCSSLSTITFERSAPSFGSGSPYDTIFGGVTATVYYPGGDDSWNGVAGQNYGGTLTWTPTAPIVASGTCGAQGSNLRWALDDTGTLTISGTGDMTNVSSSYSAPWNAQRLSIKRVVIKNGVTSIGKYAFSDCSNLASVTIADSVTFIGEYAFEDCSGLTKITIPGSVTQIGNYAFSYCSRLSSITFEGSAPSFSTPFSYSVTATVYYPGGDDSWDNVAGQNYGGKLTWIPTASVVASGTCGAQGSNLRWVLDDAGTLTISGNGAMINYESEVDTPWYDYRTSIKNILVEGRVTSIGDSAFARCENVASVSVPDSVTSIGSKAFYNCRNLAYITLPDSVTFIGEAAFAGCDDLVSIDIPDFVASIEDQTFSGCGSLTTIAIPDSVTSIGEEAFFGCSAAAEIILPDSITSIENGAFFYCSALTDLVIPPSVTFIGAEAFNGCNKLSTITFEGSAPALGIYAFVGVTATVYYPIGDPSWNGITGQNYGGALTWVPYCMTHTEVADAAVAPTCTEPGLTQGAHCSACGGILVAQELIPALGHSYSAQVTAPTCEAGGYTTHTCATCGDSYVDSYVNAAGHNWIPATTEAPKTCVKCGKTEGLPLTGAFSGGSGTAEDPYQIENKFQLDNMRKYMTSHFVLIDDIIFTEEDFAPGGRFYNNGTGWLPIDRRGSITSVFRGTLDGQGHIISGIRSHHTGITNVGLFGFLGGGAVVKNLTLSDFDMSLSYTGQPSFVGALAGYGSGFKEISGITVTDSTVQGITATNHLICVGGITGRSDCNAADPMHGCTVTDSVTISGYSTYGDLNVGGIAGYSQCNIKNCSSAATIQADSSDRYIYAGGIVGRVENYPQTDYNHYSGTLICSASQNAVAYAGGIAGSCPDQVYACVNTGSVSLNASNSNYHYVGGVVGYAYRNCNIGQSVNKGDITSNASYGYTGGVAGYHSSSGYSGIWNSRNEGDVSAVRYAGGIVGSQTKNELDYCRNTGRVYSAKGYAAGIVASFSDSSGKIIGCSNFGEVVADSGFAAGIAASLSGLVDGCYNAGTVSGNVVAAGIAGGSNIRYSYNVGMVTRGDGYGAAITPYGSGAVQTGWYFLDNMPSAFSDSTNTAGQRTHEQMLKASTFANYNFTNFWIYESLSDYPYPQNRSEMPALTGIELVRVPEEPIVWIPGEPLNLQGVQGVATFADGDANFFVTVSELFPDLPYDLFPDLDPDTTGLQTVHMTYKGITSAKTLTFDVRVHTHQYTAVTTAPTCTEQGYTTYTCVCGVSYVDDYVDPVGHSWDEGVVSVEPTEETEGVRLYTCEVCGETKTEIVPRLDHVHHYSEKVTEPTCTEKGYTTYICRCGDSYVDSYVDAVGHDIGDWFTDTEPTCTAAGLEKRECTACDYLETREIGATGHHYMPEVTTPTCTEQGYTTYTCVCGVSYVDDYVDPVGHSWDEGVVTVEPTEETEGVRLYTCEVCGETKTEIVPRLDHVHRYEAKVTEPTCTEKGYTSHICRCGNSYVDDYVEATGHDMGKWFVDTEPTCTETGEEKRECDFCDYFETREIETAEHEWDEGVVILEPTEDEEGVCLYTCEVCGETKTEIVPRLDHVHRYEAKVTEPTCTEKGYTTHICRCGDSYVDDYVEAIGHDIGDWFTVSEATCTETGEEKRECAACDYFETREIEATGHHYMPEVTTPTCTEQGYTTYTCVCGVSYVDDYVDPVGHSWDEGVVTVEPTEETEGVRLYTCEVCGETKTEIVPRLDHVHHYSEKVTEPTCTEEGYTTYICRCGNSYVDDYVEATGHDMGKWFVDTEPTCTETGEEKRECDFCDYFETREIEPAEHEWDEGVVILEPTEDEEGLCLYTCEVCGETKTASIPRLDHVHHYETEVTEPTCTERGYTTHVCSCGDSYVDSYKDPVDHKYVSGECIYCGEVESPEAEGMRVSFDEDSGIVMIANLPEDVATVFASVNHGDRMISCGAGQTEIQLSGADLRRGDMIMVFFLNDQYQPCAEPEYIWLK